MSYNPDYHAGGEGNCLIGGTDANITTWSLNLNNNTQDVTTTGDYDATDKVAYQRKKTTKRSLDFDIEGFIDGNNDVVAALLSTQDISNVVLRTFTGKTITMAKVIVNSLTEKNGGIEGVASWTANISCQGKPVFA